MSTVSIRRLRGFLVAAAEGGWVAVVYAALDVGLFRRSAALGLLSLVVAAGIGVLVSRSRDRGPAANRLVGPVVIAFAALAGMLLEHPSTIADGLLLPGPWCLALAAWRGLRRGDANHDDVAMSDLLAHGGPVLAIFWLVGTVGGAGRTAFVAPALVGTLVFVAAGLAAIGLARLERLELDGAADAAESGLWLRLLGLVVAGTLIAGLPVAWLVGVPLRALGAAIFGPVVDALAAVGRRAGDLLPSAGAHGSVALTPAQPISPAAAASGLDFLPLWIVAGVMLVAVVAIVRNRGRNSRFPPPRPRDDPERRFELPHVTFHLPHVWPPGFIHRHARPRTATDAYLAVLRLVAVEPTLARAPAETVRTHARRIAPAMGYRLNLLAADFERERYGSGPVSPTETRRALRRARDLAARSSRPARTTRR
jgi:hypothetical protein